MMQSITFNPIKLKKAFFSLFLLFLISLGTLRAQSSEKKYFRYFTIEIPNLKEGDSRLLTEKLNSDYFQVFKDCPSTSQVLIAVDASYPKRIIEIKTEIKSRLIEAFPGRELKEATEIPFTDISTFCQ